MSGPRDPIAAALIKSGLCPPELVDDFLAAPAETRRRLVDSGQRITAGALLPIHPYADLFPSMSAEQYEALREDIKKNGVREPIRIYKGQIIDGKHRQRACIELGIDPPTKLYRQSDPLHFVISTNLCRRHLTESQRSMVASTIATMLPGAPKGNRNAASKEDKNKSARLRDCIEPADGRLTQRQVAEDLGVSDRSITYARRVREHGSPELIRAVEANEIAVSAAAVIAQSLPPSAQTEIVTSGLGKEAAKHLRTNSKEIGRALVNDPEASASFLDLIRRTKRTGETKPTPRAKSPKSGWLEVAESPRYPDDYYVYLPGLPDPADGVKVGRFDGNTWRDLVTGEIIEPANWMPKPLPPTAGGNGHV